jgi:3D (Asp-Asp-Asp) domain-containing protein
MKKIFIMALLIFFNSQSVVDNQNRTKWLITAYCVCKVCCGKNAQGITASGKPAKVGMIACNVLPFGKKVHIDGLGSFIVCDRGSKRLFNGKAHIDIFMASHKQALEFGKKYLTVSLDN